MKISILIGSILLVGCQLFNFPKDTLVRLQNNTDYDLLIVTYGSNGYGSSSQYYLDNIKLDSIFIKKNKEIERVVHPGDWDSHFSGDTDSLVIFFDSRKKLIQSCTGLTLASILNNECVIPNNLLLKSNATVEVFNSGKYGRRVTYKITQSDYDRAVNL